MYNKNKKLLQILINSSKPYITRTEISIGINRKSDALDGIIRRAIQAGYLLRVKRGLYVITSLTGADRPDTRVLAQLIYGL